MASSSTVSAIAPARCEIWVKPQGEAWFVRANDAFEETSFSSAWQAELAARQLARSLALFGRSSAIRIYIRGGELAGTLLSGPDEPLGH